MPSRPPKKYADKARTQVTPEWRAWNDEQQMLIAEGGWETVCSLGFDPDMFFPEKSDKQIPEEGAWILILEEPHTELRDRFRVPLLSMWRARPHELNSGGVQLAKGLRVYPKQAVIATPGGDLHLWPHEYTVCTDPKGLIGDPDAELHQLGGSPVLDEEILFFLQSRGIPRHEAVLVLFDLITDTDFVYVTFPEEITAQLEGVGTSLRSHVRRHPRPRKQKP